MSKIVNNKKHTIFVLNLIPLCFLCFWKQNRQKNNSCHPAMYFIRHLTTHPRFIIAQITRSFVFQIFSSVYNFVIY